MREIIVFRRGQSSHDAEKNGLKLTKQVPFMTTCSVEETGENEWKLTGNGEITFYCPLDLSVTMCAVGEDESYYRSVVDAHVHVESGKAYSLYTTKGMKSRSTAAQIFNPRDITIGEGYRDSKVPEIPPRGTCDVGVGGVYHGYWTAPGQKRHPAQWYEPQNPGGYPAFALPTEGFGLTAYSRVYEMNTMDSRRAQQIGMDGYIKIRIIEPRT